MPQFLERQIADEIHGVMVNQCSPDGIFVGVTQWGNKTGKVLGDDWVQLRY